MSYYETAYPGLVSGVSQQLNQNRLPGQLSAQVNMLSDLVRGLCRRPPLEFIKRLPVVATDPDSLIWRAASVSGKDLLIKLDTVLNVLSVFDPETGVQYPCVITPAASAYIAPVTRSSEWRSTTLGPDSFFWSKQAVLSIAQDASITYQDPTKAGYVFVVTGTYNTKFEFSITNLTSGLTYTASYTSPDGTAIGDPALATPAYIAQQLKTAMDTQLTGAGVAYTSTINGAYIFYKATTATLAVYGLTDDLRLRASGRQQIKLASDLPAQLPALGANFIVRVGEEFPIYYRYDLARGAWLEDSAYGQQTVISNICLRLSGTPSAYTLDVLNSERRAAGDTDTNPMLSFTNGITGIASFKGRLVLLAGQYVCMSAVNQPDRWFRSTVTSLADGDPIEVAAAVEFNSDYRAAVEFNGSLLVTSERNQAIVPGDGALTPRTASISVVSNYSVSPDVNPATIGRSVMLPFNRVAGYLGISEALPPDSIESPLVSTDITAHIPNYIAGNCRFMTSSSNADVLVIGASVLGDTIATREAQRKCLYIHQFLWSGTEKTSSAWHKWEFAYPVSYCYFVQDTLYVVFYDLDTQQEYLGKIKLGRGDVPAHFLDYAIVGEAVGASYTLPAEYDLLGSTAALFKASGINADRGEVAPVTYPDSITTITPADALTGERYITGAVFTSSFTPTPPVFRDGRERDGNVLANEHIILRCFKAQLRDSGLITARVRDRVYDSGTFEVPIVGLYQPAQIGTGLLNATGVAIIPARTEGSETELTLSTDDYYDLNVTTLEYGFRLNLKHKRV